MPNWVKNNVTFGTPKILKECVTERDGNVEFDFEKVIPTPDEFKEGNEDALDKMTLEERLLFLKENDGCEDWYSWRLRFWDTKWNASDTFIISDRQVEFCTAWSMPDAIYKELSKKYNTTILVEYADEGISENSGTVEYRDGYEVSYEPGDEKFRDRVWGWGDE